MPIDYNNYGMEFCVKSAVLRMYGKCAQCGVGQGTFSKRTGSKVVLTVHHVNMDRHSHELGNLVPLCQACHLEQHRRGGERKPLVISADYRVFVMNLVDFAKYLVMDAGRRADDEMGVIECGKLAAAESRLKPAERPAKASGTIAEASGTREE